MTGYGEWVTGKEKRDEVNRADFPKSTSRATKNPPRADVARGGSVVKIRQHLLSHFWYYHRLRKLNYRVRDGNGCDLSDMATGKKRRSGISRATLESVVVLSGIQAGDTRGERGLPPGRLAVIRFRGNRERWINVAKRSSVSTG